MNQFLGFYTTAEKTVEGKTKVFVCFHEEETSLLESAAIKELRAYCDNVALIYPKSYEDKEQILAAISQMDGVFVCVTKKFLADGASFAKKITDAAAANGKQLLPYFCEPSLFDDWNAYKEMQAIDPFNTDPTQISYHTKISDWIERISPLSENEIEQIWNSFDGRIFLSYRKTDRKYVNPLMQYIHGDVRDNPLAYVGIWYDEALTSEGNFNDIIAKNIEKSDLHLMLVTPNTFALNDKGEPNYVISKEYPMLVKSSKPIIGVLTSDTDASLAKKQFPGVREWVCYGDDTTIRYAILTSISMRMRVSEKTPADFYYNGLAYRRGIGAEPILDNAVNLFANAAKHQHKDAIRNMVDICFDENEKVKGEDGFYAPSVGVKYQEMLINMVMAENDGSQEWIKRVVDEYLKLMTLLEGTGSSQNLEAAFVGINEYKKWLENVFTKKDGNSYVAGLLGKTVIELGRIQYLRHLYRRKDMYGKDEGADFFLAAGIGLMLKREDYPDFTIKDARKIADAYGLLADALYRNGSYSLQKDYLRSKLILVDRHLYNEMDRAQLIEKADTYALLGEAYLMCKKDYLDAAVEAYRDAEETLDAARNLYDDAVIFIKRIKLYNAMGLAYLCKMDAVREAKMFYVPGVLQPGDEEKYYKVAGEKLSISEKLCKEELKNASSVVDENTLKYLLGVTLLHKYQMEKEFVREVESPEVAYKYLAETVTAENDYDALHYLYRAGLEVCMYNERAIFSQNTLVDVDTLKKSLKMINHYIDVIDKDSRKRKSYWITLDLVEFCDAKARLLISAYERGLLNNFEIDEIERSLYGGLVHGQRVYNKEGAEKSKVLLGALYKICSTYSYYYRKVNEISLADEMMNLGKRYSKESLSSNLNDYMR